MDDETKLNALRQAAEDRVSNTPTLPIIGAIAAGAVLIPAGPWVAGGAFMSLLALVVRQANDNGKKAVYLKQTDRFSHVLNEKELIRYARLVGKDQVRDELIQAYEADAPMSGAALDFLQASGVELDTFDDIRAFLTRSPELEDESSFEALPSTSEVSPSVASATVSDRIRQAFTVKPAQVLSVSEPEPQGAETQPVILSNQEIDWLAPTPDTHAPIEAYYHQFRFRPTLIWGGQGSGKTTLAKAIAADKVANGHKVLVVNPHGSPTAWNGLKVIGCGRNYDEVNFFIQCYLEQISDRYQQFAESGLSEDDFLAHLIQHGAAVTPLCEEMSGWVDQLDPKLLNEFAKATLTESRKIGLPPLFVAHDPSLDFLGLKRGAKLRDQGMVKIALDAGEPDSNGVIVATGTGQLCLPGQTPIPVRFRPVELQVATTTPISTPQPKPEPEPKASNVVQFPGKDRIDTDGLSESAAKLLRYINKQGGDIAESQCKQCWGKGQKPPLNAGEVDELLIELVNAGRIESYQPRDRRGLNIRLCNLEPAPATDFSAVAAVPMF